MGDDDKQKMNDFFGEDLQMVLADVRYGEVKKGTVHLKGSNPTTGTRQHTIDLQNADEAEKEKLASYVNRWGRQDAEEVEKVVIEWPLEFLQGGLCLVDGPGIMATKKMDEVLAGVVPSTCAFIYMINSAIPLKPAPSSGRDGEGSDEHTDGLSRLLKWCKKHKWGELFDVSQLNLESTMFVCNKWDSVKQDEREVVKKDYLKILRGHFPELRDDQVFFLSCDKAVGPAGRMSPEFTRLLDGLDSLLPQSLQHKLELQYQ
ncbi:uncharacterized protein [Branchiostoma lanceolatum]|uniref:uncharacterized protein n=1 Tax=Branchiostoma lanceolatum TaxID=7740 RepID=UPI0034558242